MLKRILASLIASALFSCVCAVPGIAGTQASKEDRLTEKVKTKVAKLGLKASVEVKLKDGSKLKGRITEIEEDRFTVADKKAGTSNEITYGQVKQVKAPYEKPFEDRGVWLGLGLIPLIIVAAILSRGT